MQNIYIYDALGKLVEQKSIDTTMVEVSLENYQQGIYWIQVVINGQHIIPKIIKL